MGGQQPTASKTDANLNQNLNQNLNLNLNQNPDSDPQHLSCLWSCWLTGAGAASPKTKADDYAKVAAAHRRDREICAALLLLC